jgi:hypothetical protein
VNRAGAQAWLDTYVAAWLSYDEADIRALFAEDIAYRYHPYDDPIVGREAVVASNWGSPIRTTAQPLMRPAHIRRITHRSPSTTTSWSPQARPAIASGPTVPSFAPTTTVL